MRIFNTLFSEKGIPTELKGLFWKKLIQIEDNADDEQLFTLMAEKPNPDLDL